MPESKPLDEKIQKAIDKALYANGNPAAQKARNFLNGTWLGEPLHVVLTDVPIGAWTVAMVFDALEMINSRHEFAAGRGHVRSHRTCRRCRRGNHRSDGLV